MIGQGVPPQHQQQHGKLHKLRFEEPSKPLFLLSGIVGQVYPASTIVGSGVGPILQMQLCPRITPLYPISSEIEHVCVGPVVFAGCEVGSEAGAVTSVGTPEGSPPVSHHEYVVPLTVPLPMPATSSPVQEHMGSEELIPRLGVGATLQVNGIRVTYGRRIGIRVINLRCDKTIWDRYDGIS